METLRGGKELLMCLHVIVSTFSQCLSIVNLLLHFWQCSCSNWADWFYV